MKKVKKNQVIIAAMTVALGVAGYLNFSGNMLDLSDADKEKTQVDALSEDTKAAFSDDMTNEHIVLDEDLYVPGDTYTENMDEIELNSEEDEIGEAVLTSTDIQNSSMATAKLNREQVRSRIQEDYLAIINGEVTDGMSVEDATESYLKLTDNMGKEADAETVLAAKGYPNSVVSISENSVDVIIEASELTDAARAQIEETVVRKTGCSVDQIVISCALK